MAEKTLEEFCRQHGVTVELEQIDERPDGMGWESRMGLTFLHYRYKLRSNMGKKMKGYMTCGVLADLDECSIIHSIVMDYTALTSCRDLCDYCKEFDIEYNKRAIDIWEYMKKEARKFQKFCPDMFIRDELIELACQY